MTGVIKAQLQALTEGEEMALKEWFNKSPYQTLVRVLESKCKAYIAQASSDAMAAKDAELKLVAANEKLRKAQRYSTALDVLNEVVTQKEPHTTVKLL